jgi:hypothetical protein
LWRSYAYLLPLLGGTCGIEADGTKGSQASLLT